LALCLNVGLLGGCCTVRCCMSAKCAEASACTGSEARVIKLVSSRVNGCPDTWITKFKVQSKDLVKLVNCSGQVATVTFSSPDFFVEGGTFTLAPDATQILTVSPGVVSNQSVGFLVEGPGTCSHGGSTVIVSNGP
jgi:hypothetical protein